MSKNHLARIKIIIRPKNIIIMVTDRVGLNLVITFIENGVTIFANTAISSKKNFSQFFFLQDHLQYIDGSFLKSKFDNPGYFFCFTLIYWRRGRDSVFRLTSFAAEPRTPSATASVRPFESRKICTNGIFYII